MNKKQKKVLVRIILAVVLLAAAEAAARLLPLPWWANLGIHLVPYLVIGYDILLKACKGIKNGQVFDENFLMAVATVGAFALGEYLEGAAVMLFYQIGELFQSVAVGRSRRSISELMDIRPDYANVEEDGQLVQVDPDDVEVGTLITVQPGEKIPIDGVVEEGTAMLDTAALTGESVPRHAKPGTEVISGCINKDGVLRIRTTKEFGESTASKILEMVENASSRKSKQEAFISRFAHIYTPAVCFSALALAVALPLIRMAMGMTPEWSVWVHRALTFLVISCPCALVISIPLTFFAGIGGASRAGVLVKGSNYLEALADVRTVVFDKTGTLTKGVFEVQRVAPVALSAEELLQYAAYAEAFSGHPIAEALRRAYGQEISHDRVTAVHEDSGHGVEAEVDGHRVFVGNTKLMGRYGLSAAACDEAGTVIHVAIDSAYAGYILIADAVKDGSAEAVAQLKDTGVSRIVMLTGDRIEAAEDMAKRLGIRDFAADLLPEDKVAAVERIMGERESRGNLAFVGDGINDAPVLSRADVGIAMGALGSDAAIEAADVVLMDDDPRKLPLAIRIARKCLRIVKQNIWLAIGVKVACLALVALGFAGMWAAVFADVGVMVLAVLNAIRALRV